MRIDANSLEDAPGSRSAIDNQSGRWNAIGYGIVNGFIVMRVSVKVRRLDDLSFVLVHA
ncbi:hypothetical protein GCM10011348_28490 [Marinobacterium nitratireducens]|uniref:Uncharacterized protein n=1 Tax=Marinobacterium nitratireducens TaxID=518897 RepID=A0A917ZIF7_9GAMM|nr:hypothetical protein [Marinobacterium nitratireducens]GGO83808.1 hypothetical protein GCM10011348_28490 [Marinobacterium nitratireducens]